VLGVVLPTRCVSAQLSFSVFSGELREKSVRPISLSHHIAGVTVSVTLRVPRYWFCS